MPVIEIDPAAARERLTDAGVEIEPGNTDSELWRAEHRGATAVAYEGKVLVQGSTPAAIAGLLESSGEGEGDAGGRVHAYFDGACRGNPGPAAVGWVLVSGSGGIVADGAERIGRRTNNQAEYEALIRVLEAAADYGYEEIDLRGDSQLVVEQLRGAWDTNDPELRELRVEARELLTRFADWTISHVPREVNERADALANEALDDA